MALKFPLPGKPVEEVEMLEGEMPMEELPEEQSPVDLAGVSDEMLIEELKKRGFEIEEA